MPLLIEFITFSGGCEKSTMLITLPTTFGMSLSIVTNWPARKIGIIRWQRVFVIAFFDMLAHVLNMNGLLYAGSAIFTVIYSSVTVYNAIFAHIILKKHLHFFQWCGVVFVMLGLALTSLGTKNDGKDVFFGICLILVGSMIHSSTYIMSEISLVRTESPIAPQLLCTLLGSIELVAIVCWQIYYTLPNYEQKIIQEIAVHGGNIYHILMAYLLLFGCSDGSLPVLLHPTGKDGQYVNGDYQGRAVRHCFHIKPFRILLHAKVTVLLRFKRSLPQCRALRCDTLFKLP